MARASDWREAEDGMEGITIGRLTVRSDARSLAATGAPALRLRAERALAAAGLQPAGLPPSAVLVIRRLDLARRAPGGSRSDAALAALRREVEAQYRAAVRPATGAAASHAPAVLFADAAELLACLARDAVAGEVGRRWYWRQFIPPATAAPAAALGASALAAAWDAHAAALPRAFAQLGRDEAARAVALLDPRQAAAVTRSLQSAYRIPDAPARPAGAAGAPWRPWLPVSNAAPLTPGAERLLGTGLALAHAPAYARSATFAAESAAWLARGREGEPAPLSGPAAPPAPPSGRAAPPSGPLPARVDDRRGAGQEAGAPGETDAPPARVSRADLPQDAAPRIARLSFAAATQAVPAPDAAQPGRAPAAARPEDALAHAAPLPPVEAVRPWLAAGIATELAGAFCLLNLLSYLDLPHG
jgi:hypothetical protein